MAIADSTDAYDRPRYCAGKERAGTRGAAAIWPASAQLQGDEVYLQGEVQPTKARVTTPLDHGRRAILDEIINLFRSSDAISWWLRNPACERRVQRAVLEPRLTIKKHTIPNIHFDYCENAQDLGGVCPCHAYAKPVGCIRSSCAAQKQANLVEFVWLQPATADVGLRPLRLVHVIRVLRAPPRR